MSRSPEVLPETKDALPPVPIVLARRRDPAQAGALEGILANTLDNMAAAWHAGDEKTAERCLAEHPELCADPEAAVRIVYEELCLREERGDQVESMELYSRFPQWRDALAIVLDCHHLLRATKEPTQFPEANQQLGDLHLLHELGRGALGRVFLATQASLSDRLLVVKLTARSGQEHLSLARLQHTNIVPLYLVQDFPEDNLRALCMPYLGGVTWAVVLEGLQKESPSRRTGCQIVKFLGAQKQPAAPALAPGGPAIGFLSRSSYVDAVSWIGACLADALYYAHQRGLVHLDIKPSNVLLAADGQPMLLDFHLACEAERLEQRNIDRLGGTPGYMSPEQRAAADCVRQGLPIPQRLDARSDIYSLGVLLYESLAGRTPPADPGLLRQLRAANPQLSRGLEDIVCKCLASSATSRYRDAGQLATDLRYHLAGLPLRGVGNHSLVERWQKWRRRKPHALPVAVIATAIVGILCVVGGLFYHDHVHIAEIALRQSHDEFSNKQYARAAEHAEGAWNTLRWFPGHADLKEKLAAQANSAKRAAATAALHDLVDQLRILDDQSTEDHKLMEIAAGCRTIWDRRRTFVVRDVEGTNQREPSEGEQLRQDLLDLAILSARLDVKLSPAGKETEARRLAYKNSTKRELCGLSPMIDLEQRDYRADAQAGLKPISLDSLPAARNAWEHYALGRWLMYHGAPAEARQQIAAAIDLQPDDFWANFQLTRCNFELARYEEALASASVCVALSPSRAECYYNRALCHRALQHEQESQADIQRAKQLNPALAIP